METTVQHNKVDTFLKTGVDSEDITILWQFPKEFRRNWFKQFDSRFMIILISTFILEVCFILLLLSWVKGKEKNININSLQKQYASLLLNKYVTTNFPIDDTKPKDTHLFGIPEEIEQTASSLEYQPDSEQNSRGNFSYGNRRNLKEVGSTNNNISEAYVGQTNFKKTSNSYGSGPSESIGSLGLLHYLSEDNNNVSSEELREIFTQSDRNIQYLESSLAGVNVTNFKRHGGSSESAPDGTTSFRGLKGSKSNVSTSEVTSSLTPLEKANYSTIAKNTELEEFSTSALNKTGKKAAARKAEQITRIVLAHNRSIQDCYKQALKKHPDLKGKIVVRFSVTPEGSVDLVKVIQSTIDYEPMIKCIANRIRRWNDFGESDPSLGTVSYRQTYVFGY